MNNYVDFSVCTKDALEYSCLVFDVKLTFKQKEQLMFNYQFLPPFSDVKDGLLKLKKEGHNLFAFSNGSKNTVIQLLKNAAILDLFEGVISVENTKTFKPNPKVYQYFNKQTNSTKENSWLISSNSFDVIGALSYGMRSAWVNRTKNNIFDPWNIKPSLISKNIFNLHSIL